MLREVKKQGRHKMSVSWLALLTVRWPFFSTTAFLDEVKMVTTKFWYCFFFISITYQEDLQQWCCTQLVRWVLSPHHELEKSTPWDQVVLLWYQRALHKNEGTLVDCHWYHSNLSTPEINTERHRGVLKCFNKCKCWFGTFTLWKQ